MNRPAIQVFLWLFAALVASGLASSSPAAAAPAAVDSPLRFLLAMRAAPDKAVALDLGLRDVLRAPRVTVTAQFDRELSAAQITDLEGRGCAFYRVDGRIARTRAIYPLQVPWGEVEALAARHEVLRIESAWAPAVFPLLDVSGPEIQADQAWSHADPLGQPLTGKGTRVADFDTGIDVFHPSFFRADGDTFAWHDLSGTGGFVDGLAFVDLDGDGLPDPGETLRLRDGWILDWAGVWGDGPPANNDGVFQPFWDWLYADTNGNGVRDFGPAAGYGEHDPGFGEPLFIALDDNGDGVLDVGERLVQLGTSKIHATVGADTIERVRGQDLILSDPDANGHGTAVMGIVAGGERGRHRLTGIAPDAELLAGYFFSGVPISYLVPWARARAADVMLYEFGGFVWRFLDGTSLDEQVIAIENETTIQITPSGNLARGAKHALAAAPAGGGVTLPVVAAPFGGLDLHQLYWTTLWRTAPGDLAFTLTSPAGGQLAIAGGNQSVDGYYVWSSLDTSPRGTCKLDLYLDRDQNAHVNGEWRLLVSNQTGAAVDLVSNVADNRSSWADGAEFSAHVSNDRNVTWPATADSAFCNGSYSTRGFESSYGPGGGTIPPGALSAFSGRGARIDGKHLLDIVSPGNYDVYTTMSHQTAQNYPLGSYRQFSGTSAAGPHVAAAAALVRQAFPAATAPEIESRLAASALQDAFTGPVYNDWWGFGKLRLLGALGIVTAVEEMALGTLPPRLLLDQNHPNPFNPITWIPFYLPQSGPTTLKIYDARGVLVRTLRDRWLPAGPHSVHWNGTTQAGRQAPSGTYFCALQQNGERQTRKMILVR